MLIAYRRHLKTCPHRDKGRDYTLCHCPIWASGTLHGKEFPRRSLGTDDVAEANRRIKNLTDPSATEAAAPVVAVTVAAAVDLFLASIKKRVAHGTTLSYTTALSFLTQFFDGRDISALTVLELDQFETWRRETICENTWRTQLVILRAFLAWCQDREMCAKNPATKLILPRVKEFATPPFSDDEVTRLIAACSTISVRDRKRTILIQRRARALVYTFLYSGLRVSDVALLQRSALNPVTRHLTLRVLKTGVRVRVQLKQVAVDALLAAPTSNPKYFFQSGQNSVAPKCLRETVAALGRIAGVEHCTPHRFRDTFAVALLTAGEDIRSVQMLLGHKSVATTEKHYAHFVDAHQTLLDAATAKLHFSDGGTSRPALVHSFGNRRRNA